MRLDGIAASPGVALGPVARIEPEILANGWNYDRFVSWFMGKPGRRAFEATAWVDRNVVDGAVNGTGHLVQGAATQVRKAQTGNVRNYAAAVGIGVVLLLVWFVVVRGVL